MRHRIAERLEFGVGRPELVGAFVDALLQRFIEVRDFAVAAQPRQLGRDAAGKNLQQGVPIRRQGLG
ncbi:MAG: hypothetical protein ACREMA_18270, partial [Longimicrobiales bacterium]